MKTICKFKPEIVRFLINSKLKNPDKSCRKLALEASEKFNIPLSKSAINNILKKEKLSSSVGRRSKHLFHQEGERSNAGFYILKAMDESLNISKTAAEVLVNISPSIHKYFAEDIKDVMQAFIIFKSIYDVTLDFTACYNNKDIWQIVGRRPTRATYGRIIKALQDSQLFVEEAVREIKQRLNPITGFRFRLRDNSSFFIDGTLNSIWPRPIHNSYFSTTHYKSDSYIEDIIRHDKMISIFNIQDINVFSTDALNFITGFDAQDLSKQISQIEFIGQEENIIITKQVNISERRFFFLGFWPWQLDIISEFERKTAKQKIIWGDLGLEFYYQTEELLVPQHLVNKDVRLTAIILKNSPSGAARIGILTNLPKDIIQNFLTYKELYHWCFPEERYKDFTKKMREGVNLPITPTSDTISNLLKSKELDNIFQAISQIALEQLRHKFLSGNLSSLEQLKIKEILSGQKVVLKTTKEFLFHNFMINNELWKEPEVKYTCQRLNEAGIRDAQNRLMWFK